MAEFCFNCDGIHYNANTWSRCTKCGCSHSYCGIECEVATREWCLRGPIGSPKFCDPKLKVGLSLCSCGKVTGSKQAMTTADLLFLLLSGGTKTSTCEMCTPQQEKQTKSDKKVQNNVLLVAAPSRPRGQQEHYTGATTHSEKKKQCRYFAEGRCLYGDKCRYSHVVVQPRARVVERVPITATANYNWNKTPCQNFLAHG
jgi:hypothetical protein